MDKNTLVEIIQSVVKNVLNEQKHNLATKCPPCECTPYSVQAEIPVEISARHVHLSEADALALFGTNLTNVRELSQPGQYLCEQRVRLVGPKGVLDNVAILGPVRKSSQVEISKTDARLLGIDVPVRQSGDVEGTPGIILTSKNAIIPLEKGVIVAARHIHADTESAQKLQLADNDVVSVRLNTERPVILEDVRVRVDKSFKLSMHIDSDEGNSAGWTKKNTTGQIISKH